MALIKNPALVDFTGTIGKTVYKKRGSVSYMSALPRDYPMPQDPNSVYNRNQILLISKIAGLINAVDLFKMIWKQEYPNSYSSFHEISMANYHSYNYLDLRGNIILTPKTGFPVPSPIFEIKKGKVTISAAPLSLDSGIDPSIEKYIASATIFLMNSNSKTYPGPCFDARKGDRIPLNFECPLKVTTRLGGISVLASLPLTYVKLWSVIFTLDENNKPVHYSEILTWPHEIRSFVDDDSPDLYMKKLYFPLRNKPESHWSAEPPFIYPESSKAQ